MRVIKPADGVIETLMIYDAPKLDPILVVLQDFGGSGRFVIECYGESWSAFWGAMGPGTTLKKFVVRATPDYIANRMWPPQQQRKKYREDYLRQIVLAVQEALARDL